MNDNNYKISRGYVASPLNHITQDGRMANMRACRRYMEALELSFPKTLMKALHHVMPTVLNDDIDVERKLALKWGCELLETCDFLFVCGNRISEGMRAEIIFALVLQMKIVCFSIPVYNGIKEIVESLGYDERASIRFELNTGILGRDSLEVGGYSD